MSNSEYLHTYAIVSTVALALTLALCGALAYVLTLHRRRTCNAKLSYQSIESRCRSICDAVGEAWPEVGELRGESFIAALRLRLTESSALHTIIQATIDTRPESGTLFDSIEAVRMAAAKLTELERCRGLLDEANIGTAGLNLPSKAGVAERVSLICNMVKRMKNPCGDETQAPAFMWMPSGLEKRAAHMLSAFATALAGRLYESQESRKEEGEDPYGWSRKATGWPVPEAQYGLLRNVAEGDCLDAAIYCAFLWYHGEEASLMGYMSMTPALEDSVRLTIATTDPKQMPRESSAYPPFVNAVTEESTGFNWALSAGENPLHKYAKRIVGRAHELGRINSHALHELYALIDGKDPVVSAEDQPGEIPA